jgi:hypothetical protein
MDFLPPQIGFIGSPVILISTFEAGIANRAEPIYSCDLGNA